MGGDDAVTGRLVAVGHGNQRPVVGVGGNRELPHRQHVRSAVFLALHELRRCR
jgi:hypothetical protein